ncbi:FAD/NAD(P)-binding domain-containing protein [Stipitochalara longipes BDJ]|nr:FAD/NAD(P)-binding domain-containing protein [Stipitochalara longipes BDJ]
MASSPRRIHIAIIGGGIGGLSLAIGLQKYPHVSFTIFESHSSYSEIGAGLGFTTNAHRAMACISPALYEKFKSIALFNGTEEKRGFALRHQIGEEGPDEGKEIIEVQIPPGLEQSSVHRNDFLNVLIGCLPGGGKSCVEFGKRLVDVKEAEDEKLVCVFADGMSVNADAVVGCDGLNSVSRSFVFGKDSELSRPRFTGKIAYRAIVPMEKAVNAIGEKQARNRQMYLRHHGFIITYAVAQGTLLNIVGFRTTGSETWEGEWFRPAKQKDYEKDFKRWGQIVQKLISLVAQPDLWAIFDHPPVSAYHKGRLCLLGDVAHTTAPHYGQGAGIALEDAHVLSSLLGRCTSTFNLSAAFKAYDYVRVPRTTRVMAASRGQGNVLCFEDPDAGSDLNKVAEFLNWDRRLWLWDFDVDEHCKQALKKFEEVTELPR